MQQLHHRIAQIDLSKGRLQSFSWLSKDKAPFTPIDFLNIPPLIIRQTYLLYKAIYSKFDKTLLIQHEDLLIEFTRWVIFKDKSNLVAAFALYKKNQCGVKMCLTGSIDDKNVKDFMIKWHRKTLKINGVYSEVSPSIENILRSYVPEVKASDAQKVLGPNKKIAPSKDGYHYARNLSNIGNREKLWSGNPMFHSSAGRDMIINVTCSAGCIMSGFLNIFTQF
jgi:hypothetical protein